MSELFPRVEETLTRVAEQIGDPTERVYRRLFQEHPEFEELFFLDRNGGVRANMLSESLNCVLGVAEGSDTPRLLLEAARMHHDGYGLGHNDIDILFRVIRDEFRDILGPDWSTEADAEWGAVLSQLATFGREVDP